LGLGVLLGGGSIERTPRTQGCALGYLLAPLRGRERKGEEESMPGGGGRPWHPEEERGLGDGGGGEER